MQTAQDIILGFKQLSPEEQRKVVDFVNASQETLYTVDNEMISEDWLLEEAELCKQRVESEEHSSADDFCKSHNLQ